MRSQRSLRAPPPEARATVVSHAERAQEVERVGQAEGHALEHGAHDVAARVARAQPDQGARARPGRRAACARPRGRAGRGCRRRPPAPPRPPPSAARTARPARTCRAPTAASPRPRASRPWRASCPGTAWQNTCTRACGSGWYAGQGGEDDAGGAEHERDRARGARRRRRAPRRRSRPRPRPPGRPPAVRPEISGDSSERGIQASRHLERVQHGGEKRRSATSKSSVPEASATSIARSPQSRSRT